MIEIFGSWLFIKFWIDFMLLILICEGSNFFNFLWGIFVLIVSMNWVELRIDLFFNVLNEILNLFCFNLILVVVCLIIWLRDWYRKFIIFVKINCKFVWLYFGSCGICLFIVLNVVSLLVSLINFV